jgi:GNAT superfamily N-acetyltransferase
MELIELTTLDQMLSQFEIMQQLYPKITLEKYKIYLKEMIPNNYKQLAVFEHDICIGLTGFWQGVKLWSGKYIEIDNFIVHENHREKGVGKLMTNYIADLAEKTHCSIVVLDAFTGNFKAHKFYYNQGFAPKGFHFVKIINKDGLT